MSSGNYACHADTVEDKFVREICPDEMTKLQTILDKADCIWEQLAGCTDGVDIEGDLSMEVDDDDITPILEAYEELCRCFEDKTGLELDLKYHDREDIGDEVNGFFWAVEGVYVFSSAGEKYKEKIDRKFWTTFG